MSLARREDVEAIRRGLWGEGGRELRSGAMSLGMLRCRWIFNIPEVPTQGP